MTVGGVVKWTAIVIGVLVVALLLTAFLVVRSLVEPDHERFGNVLDEATKAGLDRTHFKAAADEHMIEMDKGLLKKPPPGEPYPATIVAVADILGLTPEETRVRAVKGQNTWNVWTGGNDRFWDELAGITAGAFDLLKILSSHPEQGYGRYNRWHYLGLVNEPCFEQATAGDSKYGLWLDRPDTKCGKDPYENVGEYRGVKTGVRGENGVEVGSYYGRATGVLGLRLFSNPNFDQEAAEYWQKCMTDGRFYTDPDGSGSDDPECRGYQDAKLVRPYRVGMSCGFCHVGPSPVKPPIDPETPQWANINSNPGAQYFWVDRIFFHETRPRDEVDVPADHEHNFIFQLFHTNPPGSLDTSLVSTDYINNPRTMNAVYNVIARLEPMKRWGQEELTDGEMDNKQFQDYEQTKALGGFWDAQTGRILTARVLKDGADSVGILGALNRVYLNIGLFSEEWTLHFRPVIGGQKISPIKIADAQRNSAYWGATEDQTADMAIFFLVTATPDLLKDVAPEYLQSIEPEVLERGKEVFAANCAACHSGHPPEAPQGSGIDEGICGNGGNGPDYRKCWDRYWEWTQTDEFIERMTEIVKEDKFLENDFLSTERRVPSDLLGTNACSPIATNALEGDIWDNFSSTSYKNLPPVGELTVHHPVSGAEMSFTPKGAGRGYTRPASLVSLWSTAPYLLNNSVGFEDYPYTSKGYYVDGGYPSSVREYGQTNEYTGYAETQRTYASEGTPAGEGYASRSEAPRGGYASKASAKAGYGAGYDTSYSSECPAPDDKDPYLPCVANRMRLFELSIDRLLNPERRRKDPLTELEVPGYMYRTTATSCVKIPKGYVPDLVSNNVGFFNWLAPWAVDEEGNIALGPLPKGFPINVLVNTKLLPDNDEDDTWSHYWRLIKAAPTLLSTFKKLGGNCDNDYLKQSTAQAHAEQVLQDTNFVDTLVGLSKCPDYVVNKGHYFGSHLDPRGGDFVLSAADKQALIQYLKHF